MIFLFFRRPNYPLTPAKKLNSLLIKKFLTPSPPPRPNKNLECTKNFCILPINEAEYYILSIMLTYYFTLSAIPPPKQSFSEENPMISRPSHIYVVTTPTKSQRTTLTPPDTHSDTDTPRQAHTHTHTQTHRHKHSSNENIFNLKSPIYSKKVL